tara:strand:- start:201 stop:392 length:192 start_codon:yes stop_codon:yes gene_type:complete
MIEVKLFLLDSEIAEVLENIEDLQHLQTFISLKKEILKKYESKKALEELNFLDADLINTEEPF